MADDKLAPYFLIAAGIGFCLISFPYIRAQTLGRLQSADILPKIKLAPQHREIIAGAGQNLSLLLIGIALLTLGIIELLKS